MTRIDPADDALFFLHYWIDRLHDILYAGGEYFRQTHYLRDGITRRIKHWEHQLHQTRQAAYE